MTSGEGSIAQVLSGEARWNVTCADCADVISGLSVDLVLTDPPYGIGKWSHTGGNTLSAGMVGDVESWDALPTPDLLRAVVACGTEAIVWGGNYLCGALGAFRVPLIWDKVVRGMHYADAELAWTNLQKGAARIFSMRRVGAIQEQEHPTQKPVELMTWCIGMATGASTILDPFAGSGTTGVAALRAGRRVVLVEKDRAYANLCRERLLAEDFEVDHLSVRSGQVPLFNT